MSSVQGQSGLRDSVFKKVKQNNNKHIKTCLANKEAGNKCQRLMGVGGGGTAHDDKERRQTANW